MSRWVKVNRDGAWAGAHGVGPAVRLKKGETAEVPDYTAKVIVEGKAGEYVDAPDGESSETSSEDDDPGKSQNGTSGDDHKQGDGSSKKAAPWMK